MTAKIKDIIENTKDIYMTDSALGTLLDFERVLDELDLYAFENWKKGELVEGPTIEKYFVTCIFMWPYKMMPNPRGAERLAEYDIEIRYKRDTLEVPVKIEDPKDFEPGTKYPRMEIKKIWLVEIVMPKKLITDIKQGSLELENDTVDMEDVDQAYETGADDDVNRTEEAQTGDSGVTGATAAPEQQTPAGAM
jgi:hypothetical protein